VYLPPDQLTTQGIEDAVSSATGRSIDLSDPAVTAVAVSDETALRAEMVQSL
jgi:hypothetical protein